MRLATNLTHEIHSQDDVADIGLHNIHSLSQEYEKKN